MTPEEGPVVVLRCSRCGDTFPWVPHTPRVCRSCKGIDVEPAHEPLL